jgi:hypothetical protein
MARLTTLPIRNYVAGDPTADMSDHVVTTTWDRNAGVLRCVIEKDAALITGVYSSATNHLVSVAVALTERLSALGVARVNRLLSGMGAPVVETYHRTGALTVRMPGRPVPLPVVLDADLGSLSDGRIGWAWSLTSTRQTGAGTLTETEPAGQHAANTGYVAPAAPVKTPTPPPVLTPPAPIPAPVEVVEAPEPPPAPEPAPVASIAAVAPKRSTSALGLFVYPPRNTTERIEVSDLHRRKMAAAWSRHQTGVSTVLALVGPAGTGKTSLVWDLAAEKRLGVFQFDCAGATTTADWFGSTVLDKDGTRFAFSSFIEAIREDGEYGDEERIVLLDELNRAETSAALNALMSILTKRTAYIPEAGITIRVSRNVFFAVTMNRGSAYSGTVNLDAALIERLEGWLRLDFLPEADEVALVTTRVPGIKTEDAARLIKAARQVREVADRGEVRKSVSTRMVLAAASFAVAGLSLREAAEMTWVDSYDDEGASESERGIVLTAVNSVLP